MWKWIKDTWAYECRVHRKTLNILFTFVPITRRNIIFTIVVLIAACFLLAILSGWTAIMDRLIEIGAFILVVFGFYAIIRMIASVALDREDRETIESFKKSSKAENQKQLLPLKINFNGEKHKDPIGPAIERIDQYYCYVTNPNNSSMKSVKIDLVFDDEDYRLILSNRKTDMEFSNQLKERVNLFQCSTVRPIDEFIYIKFADGEFRLDLKNKHNFDIKASGVGVSPTVKSFEIMVVREKGIFKFPYLKIQEAINS